MHETIHEKSLTYRVPERLAEYARLRDLTVVSVPESYDQWYAEAIIFGSGRPTLVLPEGSASRPFELKAIDSKHSSEELAKNLSRHGIDVILDRVDATGHTIGEVLRKQTAACNADLLVMGAYGHSRFREWVLGGATARHSITAIAPRSVFALMVRDVAPAGSTSDIRRGADGVATAAPNAISVSCANPENSDPSPLRPLAAIAFRSDQGEAAIVYASDHVGSGVRVALQPGRRPLTHARIWVVGFLTAWHERPYRQQGKI